MKECSWNQVVGAAVQGSGGRRPGPGMGGDVPGSGGLKTGPGIREVEEWSWDQVSRGVALA